MPSLIDIRRRIRSVKSTQQITKAMKMVATARLRRAQERVVNARPYARMAGQILGNVAAAGGEAARTHPLLEERQAQTAQIIVVTSDRGLAGAFNANVIKAAQQFMAERPGLPVEFELYGRKGRDFFQRRRVKVSGELTGVSATAGLAEASALAKKVTGRFTSGEVDSVWLVYNEFKSVLSQKVTLKRILPIAVDSAGAGRDYIFEQPPAELFARMLPDWVQLQILEAFLESAASEHAARMTAMDAATNNANDVINKLTLYMNGVRQASITREIIEVVSGASALE
jgi:F-type H+-transporting ATPase subunit gamma